MAVQLIRGTCLPNSELQLKNLANNTIYGFGAAIIFSGNDLLAGTIDADCPDSYYRSFGRYRNDNSYAFHAKLGVEPVPDSDFFIFGTGGVR